MCGYYLSTPSRNETKKTEKNKLIKEYEINTDVFGIVLYYFKAANYEYEVIFTKKIKN